MSINETTNTNGRADINRANSQHSTGPRTVAGKQRSSLNALRHGLTGHTIVMPSEDLAAYQRHTQEFFDEYLPKGPTEKHLTQTIADTTWRLNRITALENNLLTLGMHQQADRIDTAHPQVHAALAMAEALRDQTRALASLSTHEQRLARQFEKTLKQLREIQAERREREDHQLSQAASLLEMHKEEGLPYNPPDDGFVFSNAEIEAHIRRHQRLDNANHADYLRATS